jgi:hypothetical protein
VETSERGVKTVHFPAPEQPALSTAPVTVSRELDDAPSRASTSSSSSSSSSSVSHPADDEKQMSPDELYEYFLDRFKRDLLIEREQSGYLVIDNP